MKNEKDTANRKGGAPLLAAFLAALAFAWAFLCLGSESVFVYFNF